MLWWLIMYKDCFILFFLNKKKKEVLALLSYIGKEGLGFYEQKPWILHYTEYETLCWNTYFVPILIATKEKIFINTD